jgi:hypothetical protein
MAVNRIQVEAFFKISQGQQADAGNELRKSV